MNPSKTQGQEEPPNIDELPDELLLHIFTNIQEPEILALLCQVNRRLNRIVTPILYEQFDTPERDSDQGDYDEEDDFNRATIRDYRFVQTLVDRPDLARHVRSLAWYYNLARPEKWDMSLLETAEKLEDEPPIPFFYHSEFLAKRNGDSEETSDSLFVAAVMRTANVKHLRLFYDNDRRARANLILKARRSRLGSIRCSFPDIFQHLKSADVVLHMLRLSDLAWLMKIASLERLRVGRIRAWQESTWELGPKISNISNLTLEDCNFHWSNLAKIITTCKAFTHFSYPGPESIRFVNDDNDDNVEKLKEALDQHASTLENLHFDVMFQYVDDIGMQFVDFPGDFGSFSYYERLRELCIPSELICKVPSERAKLAQRLPSSLQTLRLTMCTQHSVGLKCVEFLEPVAKDISMAGKNLKIVYFSDDVTDYMECKAWWETQKICASNGLTLRIWEMRHEEVEEWENALLLHSSSSEE